MKKTLALILSALLCLVLSVTAFADNIYVVDDGENDYVPNPPATTAAPQKETTTSVLDSIGSIFDFGSLDGYFGDLAGMLGDGIDSILDGLGGNLDQWQIGGNIGGNNSGGDSELPTMNPGSYQYPQQGQYQQPQASTTAPQPETPAQENASEEETTAPAPQNQEIMSVFVVQEVEDSNGELSGSTLTLIVFIAAVVLLVLVVAIVLVIMIRKTEFNSAVMHKSTIPSVEQPSALAQFLNDDVSDDGTDYGDIVYWDD